MDPYLERPALWPDLHERLAYTISEVLQPLLPARYYAQLQHREEVGRVDPDPPLPPEDAAWARARLRPDPPQDPL
jgi:hypothetical protein